MAVKVFTDMETFVYSQGLSWEHEKGLLHVNGRGKVIATFATWLSVHEFDMELPEDEPEHETGPGANCWCGPITIKVDPNIADRVVKAATENIRKFGTLGN